VREYLQMALIEVGGEAAPPANTEI
jgi:hypothetical protein